MATESRSELAPSLAAVGVSVDRVPPDEVPTAIADAVVEPAVAVPLDSIPLDETPVTVDPTPRELREARTGVTAAALGIAEYGTVVLPEYGNGSELVSLFVDRHVVVLRESDVVSDMPAAFDALDGAIPDDYGDGILATGPSATADMGALVRGAHGPEDVHVVLITEEEE